MSRVVDNIRWLPGGSGWQPLMLMTHFSASLAAASTPLRRDLVALVTAALVMAMSFLLGAPARAQGSPALSTVETAAVAASDSAGPTAYKFGERTLRRGDEGPDVKALQRLLGIKATSTFGGATHRAVKKAERTAGLKPNGIVSKRTLDGIRKSIKAQDRVSKRATRGLPRAGSPVASQRFARAFIAQRYGWDSGQMSCLVALWNRESGWRYWVSNPNGRYHGIPQTSSAVWSAAGYTTGEYMNSPAVQIRVGTRYIKGRYGTPCRAWSFWTSHHWY